MNAFPKEILEAWAVHEALRRLGFLPEEIFVSMDNPEGFLFVVLIAQEKTFGINIGKPPFSEEEFFGLWEKFTHGLATFPDEFLQNAWDNSVIRTKTPEFVMALLQKGFNMTPGGIKHLN